MNSMKTILGYLIFASTVSSGLFGQEIPYTKVIFENSQMPVNHYHSQVEYSGGSWIKNIQGRLPVSEELFFTPKNSLELAYTSAADGAWKAVITYDQIRGMDFFQPADHLSFWMYPVNVTSASLPRVTLSIEGEDQNALSLADYVKDLAQNEWNRILIPLTDFSSDVTINNIEGVQFLQGSSTTGDQLLFLDQIELVNMQDAIPMTKRPQILETTGYERHVDVRWGKITDPAIRYIKVYRSTDGDRNFQPVSVAPVWMPGYADFVGEVGMEASYRISFLDKNYRESEFSNVMSASTKPMTDEQYLDMIQESNFRYYWEGNEPTSGLALENIPGRTSMIATGASGFGMMALIAGVDRKFITRSEAVERFLRITDYLSSADTFHGAYPHFLDGQTGKTVPFFGQRDNGGDLVETSFLMQGLLTARQYFDGQSPQEKQIRKAITKIWNNVEWDWYRRTRDSDFLIWHWSPDQEWVINHKLIGWNETMITYFLAISSPKHAVPATMYYSGWASQSEEAQTYRSNWGKTRDGSLYENGKSYFGIPLPVGVSNGGPLFFIHYSFMGLDPHQVTDKYTNYFDNNRRIAQINYRYCIENPENHRGYGSDSWGLTASDGPENYSANEPKPDQDEGKLTPTGALASMPYLPEESLEVLKNYYRNYGHFLYGYYGFRDAFNLDVNWSSPLYMGLNQAPIVVMIENHRTGLLWNLFMSAPEVQNGLDKLGFTYE